MARTFRKIVPPTEFSTTCDDLRSYLKENNSSVTRRYKGKLLSYDQSKIVKVIDSNTGEHHNYRMFNITS